MVWRFAWCAPKAQTTNERSNPTSIERSEIILLGAFLPLRCRRCFAGAAAVWVPPLLRAHRKCVLAMARFPYRITRKTFFGFLDNFCFFRLGNKNSDLNKGMEVRMVLRR